MHERERHKMILQMVEEMPVVTIANLRQTTGLSEATIRRDISLLDKKNLLVRVRGGAESLAASRQMGAPVRSVPLQNTRNIVQKRAIAAAAARLCADGAPIAIGSGTTTLQMAEHLRQTRFDILTNSFDLASALIRESSNRISLPSGSVFGEHNTIVSYTQNTVAENFCAKRCFIGAQAVSARGVMDSEPMVIQSMQRLMNQADEVILLADCTKFTQTARQLLCAISRVTTIITDSGLSAESRAFIEAQNIDLHIVECNAPAPKEGSD